MATNIGLRITLGGTEQVVKSIEELEAAIKSAKASLTGQDIGSEGFKKLTKEISSAEGKLKDLQKRAEGISLEKRIGDFTKFGGAITASFAGAVAAVNLFGADTEKVSQAAAAAQNVLTIAFAARSAAEGFAAITTVALTVETYALAASEYFAATATGVLATAMETLFAVIAANPIGAILVVIGLLVAGVVALTSATDNAKESEEAYQRTLERGRAIRADQLRLLQAQGAEEDVIARKRLENARQDAIDAQNELNRAIQKGKSIKEIEDLRTKASAARRNVEIEGASLETTLLNKRKKQEEEAARKSKERAEERKRQIEENARVALEALALEKKAFEELLNILKAEIPEPAVLTQLKALVDTNNKLIESTPVKTFQEIFDAFKQGPPPLTATIDSLDKFGTFMITELPKIRTVGNNFFNRSAEDFNAFRDALSESLNTGQITKEAFDAGIEIANAYQELARIISEDTQLSLAGVDVQALKESQQEYLLASGIIINTYETVGDEIVASQLFTNKSLSEAQEDYQKTTKEQYDKLTSYLLKNDEDIQAVFEKNSFEGVKAAREKAKTILEGVTGLQKQLVLKEEEIGNFYLQIQEKSKERLETQNQAYIGLIKENVDLIIAEGQKLYDVDSAAFEEYIQDKINGIVDYTQLDAEGLKQLEELYALFYQKVGDLRKKNADDEKAKFDERIRKTEELIRDIQSALTAVSQTLADFYSFQLDKLDKQQEYLLSKVVGNTEEANAKRLELDKIYQAERAELEKKAQKRQLQLTLLQAISDGAAAIVTVIKQTGVFASIAAGVVAASVAGQIAIITGQLNQIDNYRRGGLLRKYSGGGLVVGPSHEYGGVKYQGGGIELEGNESVINRVSTIRYGSLLSEINQAGGGKPLVVNNFDDSRIVEAIAKQKREPLRAYVLEQDITNKQAITKRLEQLSQI